VRASSSSWSFIVAEPLFQSYPLYFLFFSTFMAHARLAKGESDGLCEGGSVRMRHEYEFIVPLNLWFATTVGTRCLGFNGLPPSVLHTTAISMTVLEKTAHTGTVSPAVANTGPRSLRQREVQGSIWGSQASELYLRLDHQLGLCMYGESTTNRMSARDWRRRYSLSRFALLRLCFSLCDLRTTN